MKSESRVEVMMGESGQEGRRASARERENERQRAREEERRKQVVLNKQNMQTESGVALKEEGRKKGKKCGL